MQSTRRVSQLIRRDKEWIIELDTPFFEFFSKTATLKVVYPDNISLDRSQQINITNRNLKLFKYPRDEISQDRATLHTNGTYLKTARSVERSVEI